VYGDGSATGYFAYSLVIWPTKHFAYWSFRLRDISPTAWTVQWTVHLQIAHFAYKKTAGINSDVYYPSKDVATYLSRSRFPL